MPPATRLLSRLHSTVMRNLLRDETGAAAVEMAIVGPPFILLMLAIVEMGLTLVTQAVLDGAARDAAQRIRSGQIASAGSLSQQVAAFRTALCSDLSVLLTTASCDENVVFDVEPFSSSGPGPFAHNPSCTEVANSPGRSADCPFDLGAGGQIIRVEVQYRRPYILPWIGACLSGGSCWAGLGTDNGSNPGSADVLHRSVAILRNG